ncbi:hypothetical protein [Azospirillum soli]|uniref:hypothetical protein n=1 Tax=Azospirillum soli TaxID=1304799 RepID=UPI001AE20586|nr:hypothetical protein [Azospirillum soli]MBP2314219.1 hypothetical protein [Azospirillum soli]
MSNAFAPSHPVAPATDEAFHAILAALADKHAELDARRSDLARQMAALEQELTCLEGSIRVFSNCRNPMPASVATIGSMGPRRSAERSEIADDALRVLRDASRPLSTSDIVRALCTKWNVVLRPLEFRRMAVAVIAVLRLREARGLVAEVGRAQRNAVLWAAISAHDRSRHP